MKRARLLLSCPAVLLIVLVAIAGCGSVAARPHTNPSAKPATPSAPRARLVAVGEPAHPRVAEVMGISGIVELRVEDPDTAGSAPLLLTLGRSVRREPRDVCFGTYTANENPEEGDIGCQVRGSEPLVLTLGEQYIPRLLPIHLFPVLYGQADAGVRTVELIGPDAIRRSLPLSEQRTFLVAFSRAARGEFRLSLRFAGGATVQHSFELPLNQRDEGRWPRVRRRGAVFNYEVGEDIVTKSFEQIIRRFGPPLRSYSQPHGVRCIYYDVVGYRTGWSFCFKGQAMTAAAGNQARPSRRRDP